MVQPFPILMSHFISKFVVDPKQNNNIIPIPWNKWKVSWKLALDGIPKQSLRALESDALGLKFKTSTSNNKSLVQGFSQRDRSLKMPLSANTMENSFMPIWVEAVLLRNHMGWLYFCN